MTEAEAPPPPYSSPANFKDVYDWIVANLKNENDDTLTYDQKMKFMEVADQAMKDDTKLYQEMDQLADSSKTIKQVFNDVASGFREVYDHSSNEDFKKSLKPLQDDWDSYGRVVYLILRPIEADYIDSHSRPSRPMLRKPPPKHSLLPMILQPTLLIILMILMKIWR
jgi:hypothetical protein